MSFDIMFLADKFEGNWSKAMDELEALSSSQTEPSDKERELWGRIETKVKSRFDMESYDGSNSRELTDESTGLQLSMYPNEISISVPYWYDSGEAEPIVQQLRQICQLVEAETGLVAYDPQNDSAFLAESNEPEKVFGDIHQKLGNLVSNDDAPSAAEEQSSGGGWLSKIFGKSSN